MKVISRSLRKNIWREIRSTVGRFIAIFAISALGAGFYAGVKTTGPDMRVTADEYYSRQHLADMRLVSTVGFTAEDIEALRARPEVDSVMPGYTADLLVSRPEGLQVARLAALPADTSGDDPAYLNRPVLLSGRMPVAPNECLIDELSGYGPGDVLTLAPENEQDALDRLLQHELTVVGTARSVAYVSFQRGNTNIGGGRIDYFVYLTPAAFDAEVYTEVNLALAGTAGVSSFSQRYDDTVDSAEESLKTFGAQRAEMRFDEITQEANEELADARRELADARAEADEELGRAWQEILDAEAEIASGWADYEDGLRALADAEREIADGEKALADARNTLVEGGAAYEDGLGQYQTGLAQYQAGQQQLGGLQQSLGALQACIQGMQAAYGGLPGTAGDFISNGTGAAAILQGVGDGLNAAGQDGTPFLGLSGQLAGALSPTLNASAALLAAQGGEGALSAVVAGLQAQLDTAGAQLDTVAAQLAAAKAELDWGWQLYLQNQQKLKDGKAELADGQRELEDARATLLDAEKELAEGKAEYTEKKAEVEAELADAEREIDEAQQKLDDLGQPEWIVFTRQDNPGYSGFASDTTRIDAIAVVIPVFFFLVAALVCLTTMTRMVEEQRGLIGALKALGYSRLSIASKYLFYAMVASLLGGTAGVVAGSALFPTAIWQAYGIMYYMPALTLWNSPGLAVLSVAAGVLCTTLATWAACSHALASVPAALMRPKAPRPGKRVFLERIRPLWSRMGFMAKVTARNLLRYKKRFFMTIVGVAGCTALLLTGFGLRDGITGIVPIQYGTINTIDVILALGEDSSAGADTPLNRALPEYGQSVYVKEVLIDAASEAGNSASMTVYLHVAEQPETLGEFIRFHNRKTGQSLAPPAAGEVVITEKLADQLKLKVGDTFEIRRVNENPKTVTLAGITENYLLNYVYITPQGYRALYGEQATYDTVYLKLDEGLGISGEAVMTDLLEQDPVAGGTEISALTDQFDDMFAGLDALVWVIILAAAALAFVVLYNLTNINITERSREIATLKVLGFYNGEVASYVYRENLLLTLLGSAVGLVFGIFLHGFVITTAEIDEVMFRRTIEPMSFVYSILFTLLCAGIVNLVMLPRLRRVDMVESLKANE